MVNSVLVIKYTVSPVKILKTHERNHVERMFINVCALTVWQDSWVCPRELFMQNVLSLASACRKQA